MKEKETLRKCYRLEVTNKKKFLKAKNTNINIKKLQNSNKGYNFITSIVPVLIPGFDTSIFT